MLTVTADGGTVTIGDIYIGENKLTEADYTVAGGAVTLKATYLVGLEEGGYVVTIKTDQGDVTAIITVIDAAEEG